MDFMGNKTFNDNRWNACYHNNKISQSAGDAAKQD